MSAANVKWGLDSVAEGDGVDGREGPLGTVAGTRAASGAQPAYLLVRRGRLLNFAHTTYLVPASRIAAVSAAPPGSRRVTLDLGVHEVLGCAPLRGDDAIRADVVQRLATPLAGWFRATEMRVAVHGGVVVLTGSAPSASDGSRAADSARGVPGVLGVQDHVLAGDARSSRARAHPDGRSAQ